MHDFRCTSSIDMFDDELKNTVKYFKETEGERRQMCKAMEALDISEEDKERLKKEFEVQYKVLSLQRNKIIRKNTEGLDLLYPFFDKKMEFYKASASVLR